MMAERRTKSWNEGWSDRDAGGGLSGEVADEAADGTDPHPAVGQPTCRPSSWQDREGRLVEALLECTTIAGLFALLFALFVLFGAAHTLAP
ncbi:hypothetical protein [Azospirillum lipoferum]|uniref:Uncharacterized protein n=1 Tax=Azospirillum lipoferum (strain 4B) TaxID=862719 RepID=G7Z604_AZOL4|nr:hypothetical protein [Azospirillum lipoferum]CBS87879.1 Protein of unknown function [Azospirillum lipoferum 4B]